MSRIHRWSTVGTSLALTLGLAACRHDSVAPDGQPRQPSHAIADGAHNGNGHVFFLPPMVAAPQAAGTFDPTANVEVHICEMASPTACGAEIASFTRGTGSRSEIVRMEPGEEQYIVNWHARDDALDPEKIYRIRVLVDGVELAFADVDPVLTGRELKNVNTGQYVPLKVDGTLPIKVRIEHGALPGPSSTIAPGYSHMCAVTVDGSGHCFGRNDYGQLGAGDITTPSAMPRLVLGGHHFVAIASGDYHSCALDTGGAAWCWGYGSSGNLGDGSNSYAQPSPVQVAGGLAFTQLTSGAHHVCGLTAQGSAYCWGYNNAGQLGDGSFANRNVPVAVAGDAHFSRLSAGPYHTCGVLAAGGVACWGLNDAAQLGLGTITAIAPYGVPSNLQPVPGTTSAVDVTAGSSHACALLAGGTTDCWGSNSHGELGRGYYGGIETTPAPVIGLPALREVTSGYGFTCGLSLSGIGWCWGFHSEGELGNGTQWGPSPYTGLATPVQVLDGPWVHIKSGAYTTCGVLTDGTGKCWGANFWGEAGIGTLSQGAVVVPTTIVGGLTFSTQ